MGFAKYMEDNIEIFNNRMHEKGIEIIELKDFQREQKRKFELISLEEEYISILKEIEKIEIWLDIINDVENTIRTDSILDIINRQRKQLSKSKSEYIDYKFDPKFKSLRRREFNVSNEELRGFENKIKENYLELFIDNLKEMDNLTNDDAVNINLLYMDIDKFVEKFFSINCSKIQVPLIQYIREDILEDNENAWILCQHCGGKTYRDFKTCIHCKYPNGGELDEFRLFR